MNPHVRKFVVAIVVAILTILLTQEDILELGIYQRLDLASLDYRFQSRGKNPAVPESSNIIIVEINDESFKSLPDRFPWPRSYYARLIRNLKAAGAKAVGIDIILSEPDPFGLENDDDLRSAIRETGFVVLAGKVEAEHQRYALRKAKENYGNIFFPVDSSLGLVNIRNDADGVYRRYSPFWETVYDDDTTRIPSFSFAVLNKYLRLPPLDNAESRKSEFWFAGRSIPKYDHTSHLINFQGPSGTFRRVTFANVIDDEALLTNEEVLSGESINTFSDPEFGFLSDGTFKDKIVLVGSTTPEYHDLFPVSFAHGSQHGDNLMYGVELHANVMESILKNRFLKRQSKTSETLLIILCTLLTFYATSALRSTRGRRHFVLELYGVLLVLVLIAMIGTIAVWLFAAKSYVLAAISPMIAVAGGYVASTAYHFVTERKERLMIKEMFSTYVNPAVVEELIADPTKLKLGGERKQLTVLFSDIEGFTTISERLPSEELVALLNEYFSEMSNIILRNNGTVDKFFGDAIIAFWGAPLPQKDHALHACNAALEMQQALGQFHARSQTTNKPVFRVRMGINTGDMVVGNMGGAHKFDYTVIGDSVNIASRLEGANKVYRTGIMVSDVTYEAVKHKIIGRELDLVSVKGRSEPVRTFELLQGRDIPVEPELADFLKLYTEGLALYRARKWEEAMVRFQEAVALRNNDYLSKMYIERADAFKKNPPPENWNGAFELTSK